VLFPSQQFKIGKKLFTVPKEAIKVEVTGHLVQFEWWFT